MESVCELDDFVLHQAYLRIQNKFDVEDPQHVKMQSAFYDIRDNISQIVSSCSTNVSVVIYFDGVLQDPLRVDIGKAKNRLRITIKRDGKFNYGWTKETLGKCFRDGLQGVKKLVKDILTSIGMTVGRIYAVMFPDKLAIKSD